jgi:hypothetical protein
VSVRANLPVRYPLGGTVSSAFPNHQMGFIFCQVENLCGCAGMRMKTLSGGRSTWGWYEVAVDCFFGADGNATQPDKTIETSGRQTVLVQIRITLSFRVLKGETIIWRKGNLWFRPRQFECPGSTATNAADRIRGCPRK